MWRRAAGIVGITFTLAVAACGDDETPAAEPIDTELAEPDTPAGSDTTGEPNTAADATATAAEIEEWCALGPTLDEVSKAMQTADFTDPVSLETAMSLLAEALDEIEGAAPAELAIQVEAFVTGNRDFIGEFADVGYNAVDVNGTAAARAAEAYTAVAVEIDAFTASHCDEPFRLADDAVDGTGTQGTVLAAPELELVDAGDAADRVLLDVAPALGDTWSGEIVVAVQVELNGEGDELPVSAIQMEMEVTEVSPEGAVTVTAEVTDVRTASTGSFTAEELEQYESSTATMVGTRTTWTVDTDGSISDLSTDAPPDLDPSVADALQVGDQAAAQTNTPVPDEPVGVGARWVTTQTTDTNGVQAVLTTEYEVVELSTREYVLEATLRQTLSIADGEATGTGTIRQRVGALAPTESSSELDGVFRVDEVDGSTTELRMTTSAAITQAAG